MTDYLAANDWVEINDDPSFKFGGGDFTISAWVKTTQATGSFPSIVDKEDGVATRQGYGISLNGSNSYRPQFDVFSGGGEAAKRIRIKGYF